MELTIEEFMEKDWKEAMDFGNSFMAHKPAMVWLYRKFLRAKDYKPEFEKLNHKEIYVTQENVLLDKTKPTKTLL